MVRVQKRGYNRIAEYTKQEWAKIEKAYKKQGKDVTDYYQVLEPPTKEKIEKSEEPISTTAKK